MFTVLSTLYWNSILRLIKKTEVVTSLTPLTSLFILLLINVQININNYKTI